MFLASPLFGLAADLWLLRRLLARPRRVDGRGDSAGIPGPGTPRGREAVTDRLCLRPGPRLGAGLGGSRGGLRGVVHPLRRRLQLRGFFGPISAEFGAGRAAASVVFSLTSLLFFTLGALSGPAADRLGPRPLLLAGAGAFGLGLAATAAADRLWIAYLTYGVGVGIGVGCAYVPIIAAVGGWFERRRALAVGVAVSGIGLSTLVAAPGGEVHRRLRVAHRLPRVRRRGLGRAGPLRVAHPRPARRARGRKGADGRGVARLPAGGCTWRICCSVSSCSCRSCTSPRSLRKRASLRPPPPG